MFTRACHSSLSQTRWINSTLSLPFSLRSILILSLQLHWGLPSALFPLSFPTRTSLYSFIFPLHATCSPHLPPTWFDHFNNIWWSIQVMKFSLCSIFQLSTTSIVLVTNILPLCSSLNVEDHISHPHKI
jgi:hypothetical protein